MRSLRTRLTVALVGVLAISLSALAVVIDGVVTRTLERQFDARLLDDATAVAGMAEDEAGATEFEYESLPEFERTDLPAYFEAWLDDGTVVARSPSLGTSGLSRVSVNDFGPTFANVSLPDGRRGRTVQWRQHLRTEEQGAATFRPALSKRFVTVVVARGTEELVGTLASVRRWLLFLAGLTLLGASLAAGVAVAHGLSSTRELGLAISQLDPGRLRPVPTPAALPSELVPLVEKVNDLLLRVEASLVRERRFTSDVSHELRTPLAALRMTLDVISSRERTVPELTHALSDLNTVVRQMQALCDNLLALARCDAGQVLVKTAPVNLRALVDDCWYPLAGTAAARSLTFRNELDPMTTADSDPDQLRLVIANLLSNAVAYTDHGGAITVRQRVGRKGSLFEVHDSGPPIPTTQVPHLFDRFFRGDQARTDGIHCGIGLALVRGIAEVLRLEVMAENTPDGGVSFSVSASAS